MLMVHPYLMGVSPEGNTECACQTKIGQLEVTLTVNQQVLGLQIAVQNAVAMAVADTLNELGHELLDHCITQAEAGAMP